MIKRKSKGPRRRKGKWIGLSGKRARNVRKMEDGGLSSDNASVRKIKNES